MIPCPRCGEPRTLAAFTENHLDVEPDRALAIFEKRGCGPVFDNDRCAETPVR
jgi:hypothetical protein